jgi:Polyketide cyclase / dehydrase and lipid transport
VEGTGKEDRVSVERVMNSEAGEIFALIADAGKHPSFDGSGTVRRATQDSIPLSKGSKFGMAMRWGLPYRTTNTVIEFEQDRLIAWQTTMLGGLVGGRIWRFELSPTDGGTLVRETWDISKDRQRAWLKTSGMAKQTAQAMRKTLDRMTELLEKHSGG